MRIGKVHKNLKTDLYQDESTASLSLRSLYFLESKIAQHEKVAKEKKKLKKCPWTEEDLCKRAYRSDRPSPRVFVCLFVFQSSFLYLCLKPAPFTKLHCHGRTRTPQIPRKMSLWPDNPRILCSQECRENSSYYFFSFPCHFSLRVKVTENCKKVQETKILHKTLAF